MLILFLLPYSMVSQNSISGIVVDELGLPIYAASIAIQGTETITYTDVDGKFTLTSDKKFHWKINIASKGYQGESFFVLDGGKTEPIVLKYDAQMRQLILGATFFRTQKSKKHLKLGPKHFTPVSNIIDYPNSLLTINIRQIHI